MAWEKQKSLARIAKLRESTPESSIRVQDFEREYFPERSRVLAEARRTGIGKTSPILELPYNRAILTHGVHIYANLMDFSEKFLIKGEEEEASQKRSMQFLHLHYGGCDRLVEAFELQRVDFHSARLHAVVLTPVGETSERERLVKAVAFARALQSMVDREGQRFGGRYQSRIRIGIDTGPAVAINGGRRSEPEPLFIGNPANRAAHLAQGDDDGIFLSPRAQYILASVQIPDTPAYRLNTGDHARYFVEAARLKSLAGDPLTSRIEAAIENYTSELEQAEARYGEPAVFRFHHHEPPLRSINFQDHPPSNAIRMQLASVFADLDGFTNYIDNAIKAGNVAQAVANLHVLRGEFSESLREDFGGRKVRFIGDCIHGVIAEGTSQTTDAEESIDAALLTAGGLRSSFDLCKTQLANIDELGLAVGIEFGWTPACRIGLRGDVSVRCVTSLATTASETAQGECSGVETKIGEKAYALGKPSVRRAFGMSRTLSNFDYAAAVALLHGLPAPYLNRVETRPMRAHCKN